MPLGFVEPVIDAEHPVQRCVASELALNQKLSPCSLALSEPADPVGCQEAMGRVEAQQVGGGGVTAGIVDMHEPEVGAPPEGSKHPAADPPEAIDADCLQSEPGQRSRRSSSDQTWLFVQQTLIGGRTGMSPHHQGSGYVQNLLPTQIKAPSHGQSSSLKI